MLEVTAAIIRKDDKLLICQRSATDKLALKWEFPGGKLQAGESHEECIIREIKEELDLDIVVDGLFANSKYEYDDKEIYFTVFNARISGGEIRLNVHNDAKWVEINHLKDFDFLPADMIFINKLTAENS